MTRPGYGGLPCRPAPCSPSSPPLSGWHCVATAPGRARGGAHGRRGDRPAGRDQHRRRGRHDHRPPAYAGGDPATWSDHRLAAQLVFSCVDLGDLDAAPRRQAARASGASCCSGRDRRAGCGPGSPRVRDASRTAVLPFVASDEEGGTVQRLRDVIYRLPSARTMGGWRPARVRRTAHDYASGCVGSASGWTSPRWPTWRCAAPTSTRSAGRSPPTPTGWRPEPGRGGSACATPES